MATGSDSKFEAVTKYDWYIRQYGRLFSAYYNIYTKLPGAHLMVQVLTDFYTWYKDIKIPSISMLEDAVSLADKIVVNGVPQGLEYEHNNMLSLLGTRYLELANKSHFPPPSVQSTVGFPQSCRTWIKKCDAIRLFGWKMAESNCTNVEVGVPCPRKNAVAINMLLQD
jgi:hypothetical protein